MPTPWSKSNFSCNCCPQLLLSMHCMLSATPMLVIKLSGFKDGMSNLNVEWPGAKPFRPRTKKEYLGITVLELRGRQEVEEVVTTLVNKLVNSELGL